MKDTKVQDGRSGKTIATVLFGLSLILGTGCQSNSSTEPDETNITASQDVAESVAGDIGEDTGGAMDQVGDLLVVAGGGNFNSLGKKSANESASSGYDSVNGVWTITVSRERGILTGLFYASISRKYTAQFLNANGQPQKFFITDGDTAHTVNFAIVEGSGNHKTLRLFQELTELSASFVATGTNTGTVTINGTYHRAAMDEITTLRAERTLDHALDLSFIDVTGPRGSRSDLSRKVSGRITGTYTATATFTRGDAYSEQNIQRDINIVLGDGQAQIAVNGQGYTSDVETGELDE